MNTRFPTEWQSVVPDQLRIRQKGSIMHLLMLLCQFLWGALRHPRAWGKSTPEHFAPAPLSSGAAGGVLTELLAAAGWFPLRLAPIASRPLSVESREDSPPARFVRALGASPHKRHPETRRGGSR
jgi:hypothetical protein